jgi:hypothetical protein
MSGHRLASDFLDGLSSHILRTGDPGDGGVITPDGSHMVCEVKTFGGESRAMASPGAYPVGTEVTIILKTDGGSFTMTATAGTEWDDSSNDVVTFNDVGDILWLIRGYQNDSAQVPAWKIAGNAGVLLSAG